MDHPSVAHGHEVVNLISDEEDEGPLHGSSGGYIEFFDAANDVLIDLSAIPDEDVPPSQHGSQPTEDAEPGGLITEAVCLQLVLDVLPDVSIDHVLSMIRQHTTDLTRTRQYSESIINELLESTYPKEADALGKKRRRQDSEGISDFERDDTTPQEPNYHKDAADLLKDEFPRIPEKHIVSTLRQQKTLFKAYILLERQLRNYQSFSQFVKTPRSRNNRGVELVMIQRGSQLPKELRAAKQIVEQEAAKRTKVEETKQAEKNNLQHAKRSKQMGECQCCFAEYPLNQAKKDGQLTLRHVVEEAMSAALIRKCNKCKHPFIKELGCNKMSCSHCGNKQCYICSENVAGYEHFGDPARGRCALHDNVEDVHEREVKKAADEAMAQVRAANPNLSDADLMIQVSDRVKQSEAARKGRAAQQVNEFPYHMVGDRLAHRHDFPADRPHGRIGRLQVAPMLDPLGLDEPRQFRFYDPFLVDNMEEFGPRWPRVNPQAAPQQHARVLVNEMGRPLPLNMPDLDEHIRLMRERGRRMDRMEELLNQQARYGNLMVRPRQDFALPELLPPPLPPLLPDFGFERIGAGARNAQRDGRVGGGLAFEGDNVPRHRRV
ncbi:hypothetical protein E8E13_004000 [Curvularia kusanoi]|uniref:RING-type domain-containing protein n=1 Tax=Curvularia kusanoi TaxID=90978 RepID=A0A9P4W9B6_CURKU|nr:hypothetical protein E8E13_004000 [Curvularia kusanoi]